MTGLLIAQPQTGLHNYSQGRVVEGLSMPAALRSEGVNYSVYLPPDYDSSQRSYSVVYLLHGYGNDEKTWVQYGEVQATADRGIANRDIPPMIIVMPDAGVSWYVNAYDGSNPMEDVFIREF